MEGPQKNDEREIVPSLIMQIRATNEQLSRFSIEIEGSKIIRRGKSGKLEDDTATFSISDLIFDFSQDVRTEGMLDYKPKEFNVENKEMVIGEVTRNSDEAYKFPNAVSVSLTYFTPTNKPRVNVPGEYQAGDYFELTINNTDGSRQGYYLESDLSVKPFIL